MVSYQNDLILEKDGIGIFNDIFVDPFSLRCLEECLGSFGMFFFCCATIYHFFVPKLLLVASKGEYILAGE